MEQVWGDILKRFGQEVVLRKQEVEISLQALVQPCLERKERQEVPGPLGLERREWFRYMGPAGYPLDTDTVVIWRGKEYRVQSARMAGEGVCPHWWATLCPRDEVDL